jgi:hypothetical protein
MNMLARIVSLFAAAAAAVLLASCSGTGDSGNNTSDPRIGLSPLVLPEQVSVVDPQNPGGTGGKPSVAGKIVPLLLEAVLGDLPPASDYRRDKVSVYVNERSLDSFRSVNEILCMLRQSRYDEMLNKGPYRAQVDKNLCSTNRSDASSAGQASTDQSSGSTMPRYESWTVDSYRTNAQSPHIVHAWVHSEDEGSGSPQFIYAKVVITEGADTAPPYGIFTANFKAFHPDDLTTVLFKGFLNAERDTSSGKVLLKFTTEDKDSYIIDKSTLDKEPDGSGGAGSVLHVESFPSQPPNAARYNIAYNDQYFLRTDNSGAQVCLDRKNFVEAAWKYGLYNADGSRLKVNSGFTISKNGVYGWIGYWGAWFPNGTTVNNGDTVLKHDYTTNTDTAYSVLASGGKMKRFTRNQITLGDIRNIPLVWWDSSASNAVTNLIAWNGATFETIGQQDSNGAWQIFTSPSPFDMSALPWVELMTWSQSLSGMVIIKMPAPGTGTAGDCTGTGPFNCSGAANNTTPVIYYREEAMFPGDAVPATLACFDNCPNVVSIATATPFRTDIASYQSGTIPASAAYATYSFDTSTMLLTDGTGSAVTLTVDNPSYLDGISSGPLFDPTPANLSLLTCNWDSGSTCGGKAWTALPVFYVWETGPNPWNQFTTVKDPQSGFPVKFDPPLQVEYLHSQPSSTAPDNKYDSTKFFLEYAGFGDLHGIPGKCVDIDTGADADCSTGGSAVRWVPEFSIPDADAAGNLTEVTNVANPSTTYFIKTLEKEQRMSEAPGLCTGLSTTAYTLPSMSSWVDPNIGTEPAVNAAPAVIGGVVQ